MATKMVEVCRKDVLPALRGYEPLIPPTKLASIGPILDGTIIATQKKVRRGEHLSAARLSWWRNFQWWRGKVQEREEESARRAALVLMHIRYAEQVGADDVAEELRGFMKRKWKWEGPAPESHADAERIAAGLARCREVMSDELFYGPRER